MSSILVFPSQPSSDTAQIAASYHQLTASRRINRRVPFVHTSIFGGTIVEVWIERWRERSVLRNELLLQPDSVLEDAGYTHKDAVKEAAKPFWMA